MGRHRTTGETTLIRLPVGTLARIERVLGTLLRVSTGERTPEKTSEFMRGAVEREIARRERKVK
jgi:hypothetical protein